MTPSICPLIKEIEWVKNAPPFEIGEKAPSGINRLVVLEQSESWCGPCRAAIPHLNDLYKKYRDKEVYIITLSTEDVSKVKNFAQSMEYSVGADVEMEAAEKLFRALGSKGIPFAVILDYNNKIVYHGHPMDPQFKSTFDQLAKNASPRGAKPVEKEPLPPITLSAEELSQKSIKELKAMLVDRGIDTSGCFEKPDLVQRIVERASKVTYYK